MSKTSILSLLFVFSAIIWAFMYLEYTHFFEIDACLDAGNGWNYEEASCKTEWDKDMCEQQKGKWIDQENTCDYGFIVQ